MQDFKKVVKQNYFLEFQIVQGASFLDFQLAPANSTREAQGVNCLILTLDPDEMLHYVAPHQGLLPFAGFQVGPSFPTFPYFFDLLLLFPTSS